MRQLNPIAGQPDEEVILLNKSGSETITESDFWNALFPVIPSLYMRPPKSIRDLARGIAKDVEEGRTYDLDILPILEGASDAE